ncbi:hypothetical protein K435DRAFT_856255 [Dendrothele bispora CBS 962.96]|uniref:DUF6532 domain-containing protein n=1 Tax=Dendrothele bispora (strain CBS 962.96) TaxID=1314807 RepID=A0A4S8M8W5_DENBC|nr:hypothetical protein K435DRAFT_856255 [Dendrothele bispora CBS 962.96]
MAPRALTANPTTLKTTNTSKSKQSGKRKSTDTQNSDVSNTKRLRSANINRAADAKASGALAAAKAREAAGAAHKLKHPSGTRQRGWAPIIHSDSEEGDGAEPVVSKAALTGKTTKNQNNRDLEDDEEEESNDQENDSDERGGDLDADIDLEDEAPRVTRDGGSIRKRSVTEFPANESGDLSSDEDDGDGEDIDIPHADLTSVPPTSDGEDLDLEPAPQKRKKVASRSVEKLAEELPLVTTRHGKPSSGTPPPGDESSDEDEDEPHWLSRTSIVLEPFTDATRTFKLSLSGQNPHIKAVIKGAQKLGSLHMFTDATYCPLDNGIKSIATASLIDAALALDYDGLFDIADRLQQGDFATYIAPLTRYVTQRITIERKSLKSGFTATVLNSFEIDNSQEGIGMAADLVRNSDYIYPKLGDGFDYQKPFGHKVMPAYMALAYFGKTKLAKALNAKRTEIFASSIPEKPLEWELPKAMVAMAACVIHAVLQDHAHSSEENFPPPGLASQWFTFVEILTRMEKHSCMAYHRLMHDLYLKASHTVAPATHGLSRQDIIDRINWDAFVDEDGDTTVAAGSSGPDIGAI